MIQILLDTSKFMHDEVASTVRIFAASVGYSSQLRSANQTRPYKEGRMKSKHHPLLQRLEREAMERLRKEHMYDGLASLLRLLELRSRWVASSQGKHKRFPRWTPNSTEEQRSDGPLTITTGTSRVTTPLDQRLEMVAPEGYGVR